MHIASIEKQPLSTTGSPLVIRCKTFLCVTFIIPRERDCHDIYTSLLKLAHPTDIEELYAFHYTSPDDMPKHQGWNFFSLESEYLRMGVPNAHWALTQMNKDYEICDTYPKYLYVPSGVSTPVLIASARFRSRGRLPVLCYLHNTNQAAICRCSQPLAGFKARCEEDEKMLHAILKANPKSEFMYVVDTRPKINAMANRAAGKGYESEVFYSDIKFQFCGIENIHVMRSSLQKLVEVSELKNPSMSAFLTGLETSGWQKHIRAIMETAVFIANAVEDGISVLVHCSDGWDRTAQTCSLASIFLDPYYRTLHGFQALIEKEWLSFGHKFTDRCRFLESIEAKEESPVFTQFIECVWQLMQQFPCAFQFNERFLLTIHDHVYSCQFGTFIGNCEKDRLDLRLSERTYSLWGHMLNHTSEYINPMFKKDYELTNPVLRPNCNPQVFRFWKSMYNRFDNGVHPRENIGDILSAMTDHSTSLEDHVILLEKRVKSLLKLLGKSEDTLKSKLQGLVSSESLYMLCELTKGLSPLSSDGGHAAANSAQSASPQNSKTVNNTSIDGSAVGGDNSVRDNEVRRSDSESGFEDGGSQMSKSGMELEGIEEVDSLQDSPVISQSNSFDNLMLEQLELEMESVAVDWKTLRNIKQCSCAAPFEHYTKKHHCWKCGNVFCQRCIGRHIPLPGHYAQRPVPVCKSCYKEVKHSPSVNSFQSIQTLSPSTPTAPV
ncbi:myotubularin-related protein 6-like [Lingula anatina]|uniref:phosphatidylinositol-3,5-bisphosphate 3-phosphatase n=1 Tax=Lingula anatina TaxID=7574 RepID=A0A1S3H0J3_LINAN|nr:myotubularin-related protein 6-like [Lingula anatina]|eukprot:XP_013378996.1 myotubularin-related protein 6-like [Lingula anatina]